MVMVLTYLCAISGLSVCNYSSQSFLKEVALKWRIFSSKEVVFLSFLNRLNCSFFFSTAGFLHSTASLYHLIWPVVSGTFSAEMEKNFYLGQD